MSAQRSQLKECLRLLRENESGLRSLGVTGAAIFGSVVREKATKGSDIDVMIVSNTMTLGDVFAVMQPLESQLGRKINPTLYTQDEFSRRKQSKNPFLTKVLSGTIIPLIGDLDATS